MFGGKERPPATELPAKVEETLKQLAVSIYDQYELGNKSTARAMLNNVLHRRKAYVTMYLILHAQAQGQEYLAYSLIVSVTG